MYSVWSENHHHIMMQGHNWLFHSVSTCLSNGMLQTSLVHTTLYIYKNIGTCYIHHNFLLICFDTTQKRCFQIVFLTYTYFNVCNAWLQASYNEKNCGEFTYYWTIMICSYIYINVYWGIWNCFQRFLIYSPIKFTSS